MLTYNKFIFINYKLLNVSVSQVNQSNLTNRAWHEVLVWSNTMIATVSTNLSVQGCSDANDASHTYTTIVVVQDEYQVLDVYLDQETLVYYADIVMKLTLCTIISNYTFTHDVYRSS